MLLRSMKLLAASLAVAAAAAGLLAPASAAADVPSAQLTASVAPTIVFPGTASITGTIGGDEGPLAGATLALLARPAGADEYSPAGEATADAGGAFSFRVGPEVSTDYRVWFAGDQLHGEARADVHLAVRPSVTFRAPAELWRGDTVRLRGSVAPARPGATVEILRRVAGVWEPFLSATLNAQSRYALTWKPAQFGYYRLRARFQGDGGLGTGVSPSKRVIVNRPNRHHVRMKFAHYIVIVRHQYRLYYYEHGVLVRRFDVALGRPGYRTPLGYFHIYGKRKPAYGALGACAMYYRHKGGIAIHGTNEPWLIRRPAPRAFSHGCARMLNRQALWLYARVPIGTHVHNLR